MGVIQTMRKIKFLPPERLLEVYPPFLFMGVKVKRVSKDYRHLHVHLPLRWYGKNQYGTMFGGFMCALSDPLPALMCARIFPGLEIWTKSNCVDFLKPGNTALDLKIEISGEDVRAISDALDVHGKTTHAFEFFYTDHGGRQIARVRNSVYLRRQARATDGGRSGTRSRPGSP